MPLPPAIEPATRISIIVPTLNEAGGIADTLRPLQGLRARGHQVIVVDGGSADGTVELVRALADDVIASEPGRARQQNAGAGTATGDVLLFLHADTRLPADADRRVIDGLTASGRGWGRFDVRLSGRHPLLRVVERMIGWRSRVTGIATGDQAIFVRRDWFHRAGGFPQIPLMEDVALSKSLRRLGPPLCLAEPVLTSSRRWESRGVVRTIVLMWRLRAEYALGADPANLAERYR
ncbi:MAG TPA: TIGR04283 family arsenosugar biosynthesis glycosyltransferase [Longimicrobium sp.]|jgi:rSAM/selenodomain-associated transferase 2|uniref:TIGR04283 family arsenosugar biosynthesis glycosyltransferase n=1 Tax=Longimicrobium sp. TaxID=2029185 RepID=UPI002ED896E2